MNDLALQDSPQAYARTGGIVYLLIILAAFFGETLVRGHLIVPGDAATTAGNILASETLFRSGLAVEMLTCVCDVVLAMILYVLLLPLNKNLALLAAFFRLTFVAIYGVAKLFEIVALLLLERVDYLTAFTPPQLQGLAYVALRVHGYGYSVSLMFFGCGCALLGYLIYRSTYLPRLIGLLLAAGGAGYVINSLVDLLSPALAKSLFPWLLLPGFSGELALALWLIVKGVNVSKRAEMLEARRFRDSYRI